MTTIKKLLITTGLIINLNNIQIQASSPLLDADKLAQVFSNINLFIEINTQSAHREIEQEMLVCAENNQFDQVFELLEKYPDLNINAQERDVNATALHFAVKHKNKDAVKSLLEYDANPLVNNVFDYSPYRIAHKDNLDEIFALLESRVKPEYRAMFLVNTTASEQTSTTENSDYDSQDEAINAYLRPSPLKALRKLIRGY